MLNLKNKYRIYKIDSLNYSYDTFKEVINPKTKETSKKWIKSYKYYGDIKTALEGVKREILDELLESKDYSLETLKTDLEELLATIQNISIKIDKEIL